MYYKRKQKKKIISNMGYLKVETHQSLEEMPLPVYKDAIESTGSFQ